MNRSGVWNLTGLERGPGDMAGRGPDRAPVTPTALAVLRYGLPVIGCLGGVNNVLSLSVMLTRRMRATSYSVYIAALAVMDTVCLAGLMSKLYFSQVLDMPQPGLWGMCFTYNWFGAGSLTASAWIVLAMTSERLYVIYKPIESRHKLTIKRAIRTVICLVVAAYVVFAPCLLLFSRAPECRRRGQIKPGYVDWRWGADTGYFILLGVVQTVGPSVALIALNSTIIILLRRHNTSQAQTTGNTQHARYNEIGRMVITTSVMYAVLTIPFIVNMLYTRTTGRGKGSLAESAGFLLYCANYSVNFLLYVLSSSSFRATLLGACTKLGKANVYRSSRSGGSSSAVTAESGVSVSGVAVSESRVSESGVSESGVPRCEKRPI